MMELDWSVNFHNTGLWVGYYTSDMVAVIDLGSLQRISSVEVSALTDLSAWIMGPQAISIFLSSDGKSYNGYPGKLIRHLQMPWARNEVS